MRFKVVAIIWIASDLQLKRLNVPPGKIVPGRLRLSSLSGAAVPAVFLFHECLWHLFRGRPFQQRAADADRHRCGHSVQVQ